MEHAGEVGEHDAKEEEDRVEGEEVTGGRAQLRLGEGRHLPDHRGDARAALVLSGGDEKGNIKMDESKIYHVTNENKTCN